MSSRTRNDFVVGVLYYGLAMALTAFGLLGMFSIGLPFLLLGITLFALGPHRHRRAVFWPPTLGVLALTAGFVLTAPLGCTATATDVDQIGTTKCTNLIGIDYSGRSPYRAPLLPALAIGVAAAGATMATARWLLSR
jgi:hypothetical protein